MSPTRAVATLPLVSNAVSGAAVLLAVACGSAYGADVAISVTPNPGGATGYTESTIYDGAGVDGRDAYSSTGMDLSGCTAADLRVGIVEPTTGTKAIARFDNILVRVSP